jgi:hypothetical protein
LIVKKGTPADHWEFWKEGHMINKKKGRREMGVEKRTEKRFK